MSTSETRVSLPFYSVILLAAVSICGCKTAASDSNTKAGPSTNVMSSSEGVRDSVKDARFVGLTMEQISKPGADYLANIGTQDISRARRIAKLIVLDSLKAVRDEQALYNQKIAARNPPSGNWAYDVWIGEPTADIKGIGATFGLSYVASVGLTIIQMYQKYAVFSQSTVGSIFGISDRVIATASAWQGILASGKVIGAYAVIGTETAYFLYKSGAALSIAHSVSAYNKALAAEEDYKRTQVDPVFQNMTLENKKQTLEDYTAYLDAMGLSLADISKSSYTFGYLSRLMNDVK